MTNKIKLLVIVGPTAVGKTALSIQMAKRLDGEIISGDAIQVYKGMDIGSAKITEEEKEGIPHHLIDIMDPDEQYSAAQFQKMAERLIREIHARGKVPIIAGGTGLYVQSVLYDYQFQSEDAEQSEQLTKIYESQSTDRLYTVLQAKDPAAATEIHPHNRQRLIRANVYYDMHGRSITRQSKSQTVKADYDTLLIGLTMPRALLYERINQRVDLMIEAGLVEEVAGLMEQGYSSARSMTAIGYKELMPYIRHEVDLSTAVEQLKMNSRRFAKRQLTWFRNQMELDWHDMSIESVDSLADELAMQFNKQS